MLLGKVLSIVAASAALLDGSMKAAMPDKNMEGTMFLINRQHAVSEFFVPEALRKVEATGMSQSCISQHLQKLRAANVVTAERSGNEVYYQVASREVASLVADLLGEEADSYVL